MSRRPSCRSPCQHQGVTQRHIQKAHRLPEPVAGLRVDLPGLPGDGGDEADGALALLAPEAQVVALGAEVGGCREKQRPHNLFFAVAKAGASFEI